MTVLVTERPGPVGDQLERFLSDPEGVLHEWRTFGGIVPVDLGGVETAIVYDLDAIHQQFADKLEHVGMAPVFARLGHATGTGILTNYDWATWHPRRRTIVKPLGARAVRQFHERMVAIIDDELDRFTVGDHADLMADVRRITLRVIADLLFTTDLTPEAEAVIDRAVEAIHAWAEADPANADLDHEPPEFRAAINDLDQFIRSVIDGRSSAGPGDDMIGHLLTAQREGAAPLDGDAIRDEAVTLILAGHETVTNTIAFALDLSARHSDASARPARHIVDETLRIYPPVHITNRLIVKDCRLGDTLIPAGWETIVPEIVLYRDHGLFERADEFLPERWQEDSPLRMERRAYFPFLTGPKFCVGSHFALLEATEVVERFQARFRLAMLDPEPPKGRFFALSYGPDRPMPYRLSAADRPEPED